MKASSEDWDFCPGSAAGGPWVRHVLSEPVKSLVVNEKDPKLRVSQRGPVYHWCTM